MIALVNALPRSGITYAIVKKKGGGEWLGGIAIVQDIAVCGCCIDDSQGFQFITQAP